MRIPYMPLVAASLLCSSSLASAQIYKCVGPGGNVQFSEAPAASGKCEIVGESAPTPSSDSGSDESLRSYVHKLDEEHAQEDRDKAKATELAAQKKARCSQATRHSAFLESGGRMFATDEKGERTYLSDQELEQRREAAKQQMESACQ